jgi:pyrroline-5-carboxylate reductase
MQITFIGGGNMAAALVGGMVAKGFPAQSIKIVELLHEARARLAEQFGVQVFDRIEDAAPFGDLVVLAVKPQQMREAAREAGLHVGATPVLSIAAGIRLVDLGRWLGGRPALARCMPNTPALIGLGITGLYAEPGVPADTRKAMQTLLEAVGKVVWVEKEALLDPVTAVSGSGPAYFFYFIEALEQAGREMGLAPETARALAIETARGAGELAARSSEPPGVLRERVTSKGGTTERALATMNADGVQAAIVRALAAASQRAAELGDEFGRQ